MKLLIYFAFSLFLGCAAVGTQPSGGDDRAAVGTEASGGDDGAALAIQPRELVPQRTEAQELVSQTTEPVGFVAQTSPSEQIAAAERTYLPESDSNRQKFDQALGSISKDKKSRQAVVGRAIFGKQKILTESDSEQSGDSQHIGEANQPMTADAANVAIGEEKINIHYDAIFKKAREILKDESNKKRIRATSKTPESSVVEYLQSHPEQINADKAELLKLIRHESKTQKDQTKHIRLIPPVGTSGYSDLEFYVNHPYFQGDRLVKETNLIEVWNNFIKQAQNKIMLNIFDFDLEEIAETLAAKANSGVSVTVGIDNGTINTRKPVSHIFDFLQKNNVKVVAVDSIKLNHQKMAIIDWDHPQTAKVLLSSGNLTQSCLGPEGDLKNIPPGKRPKRSVPNANHVITLKSWLLANLVFNELEKTLDAEFKYKGSQYPVLGSYQITGPGVNPQTLEAYPENSFIISFSPGGGYSHINKNIIGHFIRASDGPIRMVQFAFSSKDVTEALVEKAQQQGNRFDFLSVGDTPFAMQKWSQFLKISGLERVKNSKGEKEYIEAESAFRDVLSQESFKKLRKNIRIAPWYYSTAKTTVDGISYDVSAKIHHKILAAGPFAIVGTSFNFSDSAQKNNEQILVFKDKTLVANVDGIARWLAQHSDRSVFEEALRRNRYVAVPENILPTDNRIAASEDDSNLADDQDEDTESKQAEP